MTQKIKQVPETTTKKEPDYNAFDYLNSVANSLSTVISGGSSAILNLFKSDEFETIKEISSNLSASINAITYVRKIASIPNLLYMRKVARYCRGISTIPQPSREKFANRIGQKAVNKDSIFVLDILNRAEDEMKIDIFVELFKHKVNDTIDDGTYRRMMTMVDHTLYHDLTYMKSHIREEHIEIKTPEEESLLASGWLIYYSPTWGSFTHEGGKSYKYTSTAAKFCELISNVLVKSD